MNSLVIPQVSRLASPRFGAIRIGTQDGLVTALTVTDDGDSILQNRLLLDQKPIIKDTRIGVFITDLKAGKYTAETARIHLKELMRSFNVDTKHGQLKPSELSALESENYLRSIGEFKHARPEIDRLLANQHMTLAKPDKTGQSVGNILLALA